MKAAALILLALTAPAWADLSSIVAPLEIAAAKPAAVAGVPATPAAPAWDTLEEREIIAALEQELAKNLGLDGELRLSFTKNFPSVSIPAHAVWDLRITQLPPGGLATTNIIRFRIEIDGKTIGEWQSLVRAQLWRPVLVASRRLDRGAALEPSSTGRQTIDVLQERQAVVPADTDLSDYEIVQSVTQERPLSWKDIALRPLVRKGESVDVVATRGSLNISMKGLALSNGARGDLISIRNPDSRKDITAKVVGSRTVEVSF